MDSRWSGYKRLSGKETLRVAGLSLLTAFGVAISSSGMLFQPFWAYGWSGVSPDTIIFIAATILLMVVVTSLASTILILVSYGVGCLIRRDYVAWVTFGALMLIGLIAASVICPRIMWKLTSVDWP